MSLYNKVANHYFGNGKEPTANPTDSIIDNNNVSQTYIDPPLNYTSL